MTATIEGRGTGEDVWRPWLDDLALPALDVGRWAGARILVAAAHPDDEVLGVAGLMRSLSAVGAAISVVWATDGEGSHPGSRAISPSELARRRRVEAEEALQSLGILVAATDHLQLPDSGLAAREAELTERLRPFADDVDLVLAPWRGDGHPDHEAVGRAAVACGTPVLEYPIWMWHWARPGDDGVPWSRCAAVALDDVEAKRRAISRFVTQVEPIGPAPEDAAILPPVVVARFLRPFEVVLA